MRDILDQSYGVIVYQDDVMLIAIKLAGYSWLEADKLRKAMGKKIPEEMAKQKTQLLKGFQEHGMSKRKAQEIWKLIEPFAAYGFNKAHAASYGMVAYQTAYMKANYPAEYMTALMTAESGDLEKIAEAANECEKMGIKVLPPDINESRSTFTYIDDHTIRFGLLVVKGIGQEVIDSIIVERQKGGEFKDLADFATRVSHRAFNKKSLEALIMAGALDRFGERKQLLENMDRILEFNKNAQKEKAQNQSSLFELAPSVMKRRITLRPCTPATTKERLTWEKEVLGLYVSAHPFEKAAAVLSGKIVECAKVEDLEDGTFVKCGGIITYIKQIVTKKGDPMAFVALEDLSGQIEVVVFPRTFQEYKELLEESAMLVVSAKVSKRQGENAKLLANSFVEIEDEKEEEVASMLEKDMWVPGKAKPSSPAEQEPASVHQRTLSIALKGKPDQQAISQLREILKSAPGRERVCLLVESGGRMRQIQTDYGVTTSPEMLDKIAAIVGRQNVQVS